MTTTAIVAIAACLFTFAATCSAQTRTLENGDQVNYDGTYYDFRAADGKAMVKMWVPPNAKPVRGVFISGHGGGSGDSRDFARDKNMKDFAARLGFGLAGLHYFPGGQAYETGAPRFFKALDAFAAYGQHPELANIPFVIFGSSNGGATSYGFINHAPQRALCFVANVSTRFIPDPPADPAIEVPGVFVVGMYDPFSRGMEGVERTTKLLNDTRARGGRWAMVVEEKGHEDGIAFDVYAKLVETCVKLRYPADADPSKGPVKLRVIPENEGWLGEVPASAEVVPQIAKFSDFTGDKAKACWLPSEDMAAVYRAAATRMSPVTVGVMEVGRVYNPNTAPQTMFSIGGPVVDPGSKLNLMCDLRDLPDWSKVEFFEGARKLGETAAGKDPVLPVTVGGEQAVWCLWAMVHDKEGNQVPTPPFYFTVRDPLKKVAIENQMPAIKLPEPTGSATAHKVPQDYQPKSGAEAANVLLAYGLTAEMEQQAEKAQGVAPFWKAFTEKQDAIRMTQAEHAREGSSFSIVTTKDAGMTILAAHSSRGLYLLFDVTDNRFSEPDPSRLRETDALDVLIDPRSAASINDPANVTQLVNQGWGLGVGTRQYQVPVGARSVPELMMRNLAEPWDFTYNQVTVADALTRHGIRIRQTRLNRVRHQQEWFIPWGELGVSGEPAVGTRLGFAPGYNDRDPGEAATKELRWIGKTTPWAHGATGKAPRGWGDIEIAPMLP